MCSFVNPEIGRGESVSKAKTRRTAFTGIVTNYNDYLDRNTDKRAERFDYFEDRGRTVTSYDTLWNSPISSLAAAVGVYKQVTISRR